MIDQPPSPNTLLSDTEHFTLCLASPHLQSNFPVHSAFTTPSLRQGVPLLVHWFPSCTPQRIISGVYPMATLPCRVKTPLPVSLARCVRAVWRVLIRFPSVPFAVYLKQGGMLLQNKNVGALARTMSAQVASSSHELLNALEGGNIDEVRSVLANTEKGLKR